MANLFDVGSSALNSLQRAISTTGNNIANANTDGYSRQEVTLASRTPGYAGGFSIGTGVEVEFYTTRLRSVSDAGRAGENQLIGLLRRICRDHQPNRQLMADPATSIASAMDQFFASMEAVANSPSSQPERQVMLSEAQTLANRFNYVDARLTELAENTNEQMSLHVIDINQYAQDIAQLNQQIVRLERTPAGSPNDLLDQRDQAIEALSKLIRVDVRPQDDGSVNVFTDTGHRLVSQSNAESFTLSSAPQPDGPMRVYLSGPGGSSTELTDRSLGGELGAALDVSKNVIDRARRDIGLLAIGLTDTFNIQHKTGIDLNLDAGGDFFSSIVPVTTTSVLNSGTTAASAAIDDVTQLTGASYKVEYTDTGITVTNLATNASSDVVGTSITLDGVTISVTAFAEAATGDTFLVEPTGRAAASMAITDTSDIAAANAGGNVGDNRNMLSLIALRERRII